MKAPRLPVVVLHIGCNNSGLPIGVSRQPLPLTAKDPDVRDRTDICSLMRVTNALPEPVPGYETPNGLEIIDLLQRVQARLRDQQLVATLDTETEDLVRLDIECGEMLKGLGHDPVNQEALDAGKNLCETLEKYVSSIASDAINVAIGRLVDASIAAKVQGTADAVIRRLAEKNMLNVSQPPGENLPNTVRRILSETIK